MGFSMVSVSMGEVSNAIGEWKLKEVFQENSELLVIDREGEDYVVTITTDNRNINNDDTERLTFSVKVGNSMGTMIEIIEKDEIDNSSLQEIHHQIHAGPVMSTRMYPGSEEKREIEDFMTYELPKMTSMDVKTGDELVLSYENGSRIICEPFKESKN